MQQKKIVPGVVLTALSATLSLPGISNASIILFTTSGSNVNGQDYASGSYSSTTVSGSPFVDKDDAGLFDFNLASDKPINPTASHNHHRRAAAYLMLDGAAVMSLIAMGQDTSASRLPATVLTTNPDSSAPGLFNGGSSAPPETTPATVPLPEPSPYEMAGLGALAMLGMARRKKRLP